MPPDVSLAGTHHDHEPTEELKRELAEARDQQVATSEILRIISRSPSDLPPVLDTIVATATRLCGAEKATIRRRSGDAYLMVAEYGCSPEQRAYMEKNPLAAGPGTVVGRAGETRKPVYVADVEADPGFRQMDLAMGAGFRAALAVPLLREGEIIGVLMLLHSKPDPFTADHIERAQTFADQAVIAIENARLFEAEQVRTREVEEALETQTATAAILRVIASSPSDLAPVLSAVAESASRLCGAFDALVLLRKGDELQTLAHYGPIPAHAGGPIERDWVIGRAFVDRTPVQVEDLTAAGADFPRGYAMAIRDGFRTSLAIPMQGKGEPVGVICVRRTEPRPFTEKQIALLLTFADQAVIAIENARLFEAEQTRTKELQARTRELTEALEQQTATADVLKVISRSALDLQRVLDALVESAARLCNAYDAAILQVFDDGLRLVAHHGPIPTGPVGQAAIPIVRGFIAARAVLDRRTIQVSDMQAADEYPETRKLALQSGWRTALAVPLVHAGEVIGVIVIRRAEVRPFTERQIELVNTFADQAVIAIENTRLFEAEQARTKELTESLEYQTALADVLGIISRSPSNLPPVLDAIAASARRLCEASDAVIERLEADRFYNAAHSGTQMKGLVGRQLPLTRQFPGGRAVLDRKAVIIDDIGLVAESEYPDTLDLLKLNTIHSVAEVPLLSEGRPLGSLAILRAEVRPFTNKEIAMLESFASQAVIAIENTRLFEEVQARTHDLQMALDQQTSSTKVLSMISATPGEVRPIFDTILEESMRLCEAHFAVLHRFDGSTFSPVCVRGGIPELVDRYQFGLRPSATNALGRILRTKEPVHFADVREAPGYKAGDPAAISIVEVGGARSYLLVPLVKDNEVLGGITVFRQEVRPFSQKQIELLKTFADQAVIAIENARLFEEVQTRTRELQESLEYQTATSDVLGVINRSKFDLTPVLDTIARVANSLCANDVTIQLREGETLRAAAHHGSLLMDLDRRGPIGRDWVSGRAVVDRKPIHVHDLGSAGDEFSFGRDLARQFGHRTTLAIPLLREDEAVGCLLLRRLVVEPFSGKQIALLQTFADQAVIAIENTRLFEEIAQKSRELEIASQHKSQFVANMSHELRTPLAAILGYAELMQEGFYEPLGQKSLDALTRIRSNGKHLLGLINTVLDIAKIESGQFTLNMAEYAIESVVETVRSATESLAQNKKLALKTEVAKSLPIGLGDEQRLTQVLLNLVGNAIKFTDTGEVRITATAVDGRFSVIVTDTGPGIPEEHQARIFDQFHQVDSSNTKAKGGTGLGLAIAKQIVEMHGGRIWVESTLGKGSMFQMELPTRAAAT